MGWGRSPHPFNATDCQMPTLVENYKPKMLKTTKIIYQRNHHHLSHLHWNANMFASELWTHPFNVKSTNFICMWEMCTKTQVAVTNTCTHFLICITRTHTGQKNVFFSFGRRSEECYCYLFSEDGLRIEVQTNSLMTHFYWIHMRFAQWILLFLVPFFYYFWPFPHFLCSSVGKPPQQKTRQGIEHFSKEYTYLSLSHTE